MMRLHSRTNERSDGNQFDVGGRGGACRPPPLPGREMPKKQSNNTALDGNTNIINSIVPSFYKIFILYTTH
jgi:hypothetical protein